MYGLPGLDLARWRRTLQRALALEPQHLSCYMLTLEHAVPMARWVEKGRVSLPRDESIARQYELARELLAAHAYEHYEISNWALPGLASRHNLTYWRDEPYLGVGVGAAGSWFGVRHKNTTNVRRYIQSTRAGTTERAELETTPHDEQLQDYLALTLRLREGLDPLAFNARFGLGIVDALGPELAALVQAGHLEWRNERLRVSDASLLLTNEILSRLFSALMLLPRSSEAEVG
jgi:oxygen-independent coproporphyrinogen-3 oxidase